MDEERGEAKQRRKKLEGRREKLVFMKYNLLLLENLFLSMLTIFSLGINFCFDNVKDSDPSKNLCQLFDCLSLP